MQFQQETYMIGELEEQLQALKAKKDELESLAQSLKIVSVHQIRRLGSPSRAWLDKQFVAFIRALLPKLAF